MRTSPETTRPPSPAGGLRRRPTGGELVRQVARREIVTKLRDRTYLISILVFLAIIVALTNFLVDVIAAFIDPRVRY